MMFHASQVVSQISAINSMETCEGGSRDYFFSEDLGLMGFKTLISEGTASSYIIQGFQFCNYIF